MFYVSGNSRAANGALGNHIDYVLDNMGNRISESHYDATGALQKKKTRVIDSLNRLQQDIGGTTYATAPTQAITQYGYDNNGNLTTTTDPLGRITTNGYDALNRLVSVIDPYNGSTKPTTYLYDQAGNLTEVTDPQGLATTYTYNGHNNLITQVSPDTGTTKFTYNSVGNVTAKLDAMNRCTVTAYDTLNRAATMKHIASATAATCLPGSTATATETVSYTYDSITATIGGAGGKGRLGQLTDGTGNTKYVYDKNGRVISKAQTITGATNPTQTVTYTYNASNNNGTSAGGYLGRVSAITLNGAYVVGFNQYLAFGPISGWAWGNHQVYAPGGTYPNNLHSRLFDLDYRPTAVFSDPEGYNRNIAWDQANRVTGITVPGTSGGAPTITIPGVTNALSVNQSYSYDALDRLTSMNPGNPAGTNAATGLALLPKAQFSYDAIGNRTSRLTTPPGSTTASTASYAYPNLSTTTGTKRHVLTAISGAQVNAYTYDATGNTTTESAALGTAINPTVGTALIHTYDAKNRLNKTQIGSTAADTVTYKINALGQRVQKTGAGAYVYSTSTTINASTGLSSQANTVQYNARFVYDEQGRLLGEYSPEGKLISETIWLDDLPVATIRPKGSSVQLPLGIAGTGAATANNTGANTSTNPVSVDTFYLHPDHLGTPRVATRSVAVAGATSGPNAVNKAVWRWDSDPFGTSLDNSKPNGNPQNVTGTQTQVQAASFRVNNRFPGQLADAESGKYYNYFRDYDPAIGRYSTSDPIGLRAGLNTFGYVGSDPLKYIDPKGLFEIDGSCCGKNKDLGAQIDNACQRVAASVSDPKLRDCILERCKSAKVSCDGGLCLRPGALGYNLWGSSVTLCTSGNEFIGGVGQWGCVAVHEWAHSCGWGHGDGKWVPSSSGTIDIPECTSKFPWSLVPPRPVPPRQRN